MLGFQPYRLKFVQLDGCFTGRLRLTSGDQLVESPEGHVGMLAGPESDMSWALRMVGGIYGQFYQGWWEKGDVTPGMSVYEIFSVLEWTKLKEGENLYQAVFDTFQVAPYGAVEDFRMYGMGDMLAVRIE